MVCKRRGFKMRARNYRASKGHPYTRKEFVKGFPQPKITKFTMGDTKSKFEYEAKLIALEKAQIRHNALEAARVAINRVLMDKLANNYRLQIHPYPHVILRENKMIFGAHADRLQDGMRRAFGKPIGTAARIEPNQTIATVNVNANGLEVAKEALRRGSAKLPIPCRIIIEKAPLEEVKTVE
ncbi:MAG: 50S ribosomal protein L16 [Candidatus Bathycorpusculaceae bacterium]